MKNMILIKLLLILALSLSMSIAKENRHTPQKLTQGMKIFKKKMRKGCRSTAIRFSRLHTQQQWVTIKEKGMLQDEAQILCPNLDASLLSAHDWNQIYTFVTNHSSDNPIIFEC